MKKINTLSVDLGDRSYPIFIGEGLLASSELLAPHIHGDQLFIVTNEVIAPLYLDHLVKALKYSPVPPTTNAIFPFLFISLIFFAANLYQEPVEKFFFTERNPYK